MSRNILVCYLSASFGSFLLVGFLALWWPSLLPFDFFEFWTVHGSVIDAALRAWPIYLFGIALNFFILFSRRDNYKLKPIEILSAGFGISLWAGVMEELCFRWLLFFSAIIVIPLIDWFFLGFIGLHIVRWAYSDVLCPVANFFTLGYLEPYLLDGYGWAVGAAIISANGRFRNGHTYQGLRGTIIAWFLGMYFFWVVFTYGLFAAMLVHFLYDFFIFIVSCLDAMLERKTQRRRRPSRA